MKPTFVKECCQKDENMSEQFSKTNKLLDKSDIVTNICKVCGCRHFTLKTTLGKMGSVITHNDKL